MRNKGSGSTNRHKLPRRTPSLPKAVSMKSERPFVIRIRLKGVPLDNDGIPRVRASARAPKRKLETYTEHDETDSDDFLTDSDDDGPAPSGPKGGRVKKLKRTSTTPAVAVNNAVHVSTSSGIPSSGGDVVMADAGVVGDQVEAPPPGVLGSLWYSRESVLHIWVVEKIIGWKTRSVTKLKWTDPNAVKCLDQTVAATINTKALANPDIYRNPRRRTELSRIQPTQCPIVMTMAANREAHLARERGDGSEPAFVVAPPVADEREEVLLVKWRGKSFLHCSWERHRDLQKLDPTNTARNKIKRYYQSQEMIYGKNWRQVLEMDRNNNTAGTQHPSSTEANKAATGDAAEEEFFPSQNTEVERILACDESEMKMEVFAKQRALNIREEQMQVEQRDKEEHVHTARILENLPLVLSLAEESWDPEDYVRYVVKWKGLQYSEMTWEYWKDIKKDAVHLAEDFWWRQRSPSMEDALALNKRPHPHMRDFRKLTESPKFGVSFRERPVANLGDGVAVGADDEEEKDARVFKLRNYQLEGVNWLLFNWWNRRSCILADEMGLGKTIQSVTFLQELHSLDTTQVRGPFLVVAPLSLIGQWQSESQTWAPDLNVVFYHGSADARNFLVQQEFYYTDQFIPKSDAVKLKKQHITKFHILITTYEVVLKDIAVLSKVKWKALIVDEAHRLKNPKARLFEELATVPRDFCLLLTGTPLQNSTEELWALLHFSDPVAFKSKEDFVEKFGQLQDAEQVSQLHAVLKPYLLRRVKEDVEKSLPPKQETILEVSLTPIQKQYYKAIYEKNTTFLFKGAKPANTPSLMNVMMELRKCCNHPFLIKGAEERILADAAASLQNKTGENGQPAVVNGFKMFGDQLVKSSGKFVLMGKLLPKLFSGGHKVLIFSQMVRVLDLLEELIKVMKYRYERLDGSTSASSRSASVDRFNKKSCQRFVMLLSTRAGGLGLNLTAADTVVIFDSDWNPQNDLQAMARAHRIGQTRAVRVYRLLTAKTYEMHMFHSASMKLGLDRAVLAHQRQQEGDEGGSAKNKAKSERQAQAKQIDELLKKGAYDVFNDEDEEEAKQFMETDIDALLEKSAKNVTYGNTADSSLSSGLGSFSKASFVADTGDGAKDVDLDDPDFWEKAVGLDVPIDTPEEIENMIDDGVKRSRKQVQQYDPYAELHEAEQKKRDKIEKKLREEKEDKERKRLEKKLKKMEEKEKKKREKEAEKKKFLNEKEQQQKKKREAKVKVKKEESPPKEAKPKKPKKSLKQRSARLAEFEDPVFERLRQAWEEPQRNRASSAILRFGFGRFCKVRHESNLTSLPLQDIEIFARAYIYQVSLQVGVMLMSYLKGMGKEQNVDLRPILSMWLGSSTSDTELDWIAESVTTTLDMQMEVENGTRTLRVPLSLTDKDFVNDLRAGCALRGLRRLGILTRLNFIVEAGIGSTLEVLGAEERGRRGCIAKSLGMLDGDLRARHLSTEELSLAVGCALGSAQGGVPVAWWNRSCDIALLVGTYIHGFGNYEAMRLDQELPFAGLIELYGEKDLGCSNACVNLIRCSNSACKVFEAALESSRFKSKKEGYAAVAAAVANSKKSVGERASKDSDVYCIDKDKDDSHLITLTRLAHSMREAMAGDINPHSVVAIGDQPKKKGKSKKDGNTEDQARSKLFLPMPDGRVLDNRVVQLVNAIEGSEPPEMKGLIWDESEDGKIHSSLLRNFGESLSVQLNLQDGVGYNGYQCGTDHRSLDDGSDFGVGPATQDLCQVAYGNDAPRYLRAICCPINLTRYAVIALVLADPAVLDAMLVIEESKISKSEKNPTKQESSAAAEVTSSTSKPSDGQSKATENGAVSTEATEEAGQQATPAEDAKKPEFDNVVAEPVAVEKNAVALSIVPEPFNSNARFRAAVCVAALHFGYPGSWDNSHVSSEISERLETDESPLLSKERFQELAMHEALDMPSSDAVKAYVDQVLLPFCVRLCVSGNGPTTRNARGSKGKYDTPYGISLHQEPVQPLLLELPDPTKELSAHSLDAVARAAAILRRFRLVRSSQWIVREGGLPLEQFPETKAEKSKTGLPMWWNTTHDLTLLVSVATSGIFGLSIEENRSGTAFERSAIEQHLEHMMEGRSNIPESIQHRWIEQQADAFPSFFVLERRLAILCAEATKGLDCEDPNRYHHLPMFDHQAWPRI